MMAVQLAILHQFDEVLERLNRRIQDVEFETYQIVNRGGNHGQECNQQIGCAVVISCVGKR
ncbi:hypothetical protein MW887_002477 [Aspergillus wentii]|nr:hypothetical protein MW887_002477 [Aspergillus wentii]